MSHIIIYMLHLVGSTSNLSTKAERPFKTACILWNSSHCILSTRLEDWERHWERLREYDIYRGGMRGSKWPWPGVRYRSSHDRIIWHVYAVLWITSLVPRDGHNKYTKREWTCSNFKHVYQILVTCLDFRAPKSPILLSCRLYFHGFFLAYRLLFHFNGLLHGVCGLFPWSQPSWMEF